MFGQQLWSFNSGLFLNVVLMKKAVLKSDKLGVQGRGEWLYEHNTEVFQ